MEALSWLLLILGTLCGATYLYFRHGYTYWRKRGVRYLEPSFPTGNSKDIILMTRHIGDVYEEYYHQLAGERYGGIYLLMKPQLILRDPELIKTFLVKDFEHFHDHAFAADETIDPLSGNLFMLTGYKWKDMRTKLSPTFTSGKMKMMFHTFAECGTQLGDHLKTSADMQETLEVKDVMARFTTDIIASCAFGIQCNCLKDPNAEFRKWGRRLLEVDWDRMFRDLLWGLFPSLAKKLKIPNTPSDITTFFQAIVKETVGFREKHSIFRKDFLQLLLELRNKSSADQSKYLRSNIQL